MPCNGGHTYSPPDHTSCEEYEKKLIEENDELTRLLCYLCGRLHGEGKFNKMPTQLVRWWMKHQKLDYTRVTKQMAARLKKKPCNAAALAGMFITEAMKAHPLSDYHQLWLRAMAVKAVCRHRARSRVVKNKLSLRERALRKLSAAERNALGFCPKLRKRKRR